MSYEINRAKIIERIITIHKMVGENTPVRMFIDAHSLADIDRADILGILMQFQKESRLIVKDKYFGNQLNISGPWNLLKEPRHYIEIEKIDIPYFEEEFLKIRHYIEDASLSNGQKEFYIVYTPERKVLLNGKIEIAQPDFNSENDLVFKYLYDHPEIEINLSELKAKTHMSKSIDKVLANLGFVKGLRSAFFDINKKTIKFKKRVIL